MAAAFPRDHVPESTLTVYATELRNLDIDILGGVIDKCISGGKAFPTIGEIRESYAVDWRRQQDANRKPMLDAGATQMPESIKAQWRETLRKMDERGDELEGEAS